MTDAEVAAAPPVQPANVPMMARNIRRGQPQPFLNMSVTHAVVFGKMINFCWRFPRDVIQAHHRKGEFYKAQDLAQIAAYFPLGGVFVDIGANVGNHSLFVGKFLSPSRIIPIEPNALVTDLLAANLLLNDLAPCCDLSHVGIGASDETVGGFGMSEAGRNIGAARMVAGTGDLAVRVGDDILAGVDPSLIKIDVEGMEMRVLRGLAQTIARARPTIFVEVDNDNDAAFHDWIASNNYRVGFRIKRYRANTNYLITALIEAGTATKPTGA